MPKTIKILKDNKGTYGFQVRVLGEPEATVYYRQDYIKEGYQDNEIIEYIARYDGLRLHGIPRNKKAKFPGNYSMAPFAEKSIFKQVVRCLRQQYYDYGPYLYVNPEYRYLTRKSFKDPDIEYISKARADQIRKKWYALEAGVKKELNYAIAACLNEDCADQEALKVARKFPRQRGRVYLESCKSERVKQLFESFPLLAYIIYCSKNVVPGAFCEAKELVEKGAKLKVIAERVMIPMTLKKIRPGAVDLIDEIHFIDCFKKNPELINTFLPWQTPYQRRWLMFTKQFLYNAEIEHPGAARWFIKNLQYKQKTADMFFEMNDLRDWVTDVNLRLRRGNDVPRSIRFNPNMSFRRAKEASENWHAMIPFLGSNIIDENHEFDEPWLPEDQIDNYTIKPIKTAKELYIEGKEMKHCVNSYAYSIIDGRCYIYSVEKNGKKAATLELKKKQSQHWNLGRINLNQEIKLPIKDVENKSSIIVNQLRGKCNASPPGELKDAVYKWFNKHNPSATEKLNIPEQERGFEQLLEEMALV